MQGDGDRGGIMGGRVTVYVLQSRTVIDVSGGSLKQASDSVDPCDDQTSLQFDIPTLEGLCEHVRFKLNNNGATEENFHYMSVYWKTHEAYERFGSIDNFVDGETFLVNIEIEDQRHDFFTVLQRGAAEGASLAEKKAIVSHNIFWINGPLAHQNTLEPPSAHVLWESQRRVIENSWTADFVGKSPLEGLKRHVVELLDVGTSNTTKVYGRYCSIVQSSGMGKSRLLDGLSKDLFVIPINLRPSSGRGFPPPDSNVRNFLTSDSQPQAPHQTAASHVRHFLLALFKNTASILAEESMGSTKADRISNFRAFMSRDQSMNSPGQERKQFYETVVDHAKAAGVKVDLPSDNDLTTALDALETVLNRNSAPDEHSIKANRKRRVDIFLAFDEAHTLTDCYDDQEESRFVVLRRALSSILSHSPLFSFFLSTSSKITQFGQSRGHDNSDRINSGCMTTPRPYIYVGFDQLVQNRKVRRGSTLDDVTSLDFIAHLGRPLWASRYDHGDDEIRNSLLNFALQKLLCAPQVPKSLTETQVYAVLSQRLALDVNTPRYLLASANPLQLMQTTHEQVANHMRVSILSEAASRVMQESKIFSLPAALALVLTGFFIDQGDRGELLVAAFFTWARDKVILDIPRQYWRTALMSTELPSLYHSKAARRPFGEVFDKAHMHFNHFTSMHQTPRTEAPGAQAGFDAVYPYLYGGTDLDPKKVGFIIVQVKNDSNTQQAQADAFPNMDPFKCGLLDNSDLEDGKFPIPIMRLLFRLSSTKGSPPSVTVMPSKGTTKPNRKFTSYDFVCTGVDENILQPVAESPDVWASLVNNLARAELLRVCKWARRVDGDIVMRNGSINKILSEAAKV
ncbi:hypothetical protein EDB89DRAFT_2068954 [Lactarius sanguifluus]|nr:hypothetical protein EDB89DRAFT_2068954 [Lactarius sanguifluus]